MMYPLKVLIEMCSETILFTGMKLVTSAKLDQANFVFHQNFFLFSLPLFLSVALNLSPPSLYLFPPSKSMPGSDYLLLEQRK